MHEAAYTGGHIQLITWLSSTALEDCAGSDPQNKLWQVVHAYAVLGMCQSRVKLTFFIGQCEFYQEESWTEGLVLLGFLKKCVYTMGHCSERAEKVGEAGQGKNQEESESKEDSKSILKLELSLSSCEIFTELKFELK